ncbi:MAG: type II secretion system protein [Planctomycetes bacterium]|nr:type II secretion system protein [Planctomycetota bacterium]
MTNRTTRSDRGGFTLIEVAVATVIVGIALAALLVATASNTRVNDAGSKMAQAIAFAQEIREWTLQLPFSDPDPGDAGNPPGPDGANPQVFVDDLDDLMEVTYSPPRDGQGGVIYGYNDWSETINLSWRDPNDPCNEVSPGASDLVCVRVDISHQGKSVYSTAWLVARKDQP